MGCRRLARFFTLAVFVFAKGVALGADNRATLIFVSRDTACGARSLRMKMVNPSDPTKGRVWVCVNPSPGCKSGSYVERAGYLACSNNGNF